MQTETTRERKLAIDLTLGPCTPLPTAAEMVRFGPRDVTIITGQQDEISVIRVTHPKPETVIVRATPFMNKGYFDSD
jgi:hypothetical protein